MTFNLQHSIQLLSRTPSVLTALLAGLPHEWVTTNEGPSTWSPFDVLGHLIHGERTDWVPRAKIILSEAADKRFVPFDRFAQLQNDQNQPIEALLAEFAALRAQNIAELTSLEIDAAKLSKTGVHPEFGGVTLQQLLATWTVHDLGHITQIARVLAKNYQLEVGPWRAYLGVLQQ